jgi:hypothetical protein
MDAIEFYSCPHNGMIKLPTHLNSQWNEKPVRVILMEAVEKNAEVSAMLAISYPSRIAGLHRGAIQTSDDFDEPLPDDFWLSTL